MSSTESGPQLVVVGSSAGGIEALSTFVETLPSDFPASVIVAQHLDPTRPSQLVSILERHSTLPVRPVTDHAALEPGVVFVVPANENVTIIDHAISLAGNGGQRPTPSIDRLFGSAASAYGDDLIAVILTGTGSDGSNGARLVKQAGGTVVIENPETAEYPSMPQSLSPTLVDFVVDLRNIGPLLHQLLTEPIPVTDDGTVDGEHLAKFLQQLKQQSNIDFSQYRTPTILRRLQRRMAASNTRTLDQYLDYLSRNPDEYQALVSSFLIKVTEFFRDESLFECLQEHLLPELIAHARQNEYQLRFWSAGCATGEEAYSLAILLVELLGDELHRFNIRIFATDLDLDAIMYARRGIYPEAALDRLSPDLVQRYFSEYGGEYEVTKAIRSMVIFGQHDLARRSPFPRIDLILCRNVLIYFSEELQNRALRLFAFSLRHGGYLALGKTESAASAHRTLEPAFPEAKIYRRYGEAAMMPTEHGERPETASPPAQPPLVSWSAARPEISRSNREARQARVSVEKTEHLLFNLPAGVVVIDENYDILMINNAARRLLGIHGVAVGEDLIHLSRSLPLGELRDVIDQTFREREQVEVDVALPVQATGDRETSLHITSYLHELAGDDGTITTVVLMLSDVSASAQARKRLEEELRLKQAESEDQVERAQHLSRLNRELHESNSELASANEQLRTYNQQLLVAHEEAQVSAEEIETLNEELQATNEELETLNEELQATVEELNATNEDMQARTADLQVTAVSLNEQRQTSEAERSRLEAVLGSMDDSMLVVGSDFTVQMMNPDRCEEMFGKDLARLLPEDENGDLLPEAEQPQVRAARDAPFTMQFNCSIPGGGRRWYEANATPILRTDEPTSSVLVIRDITDSSLRQLQEEFMSIASHELRTPLTALRGYLELLQSRLSSEDERAQRHVNVALAMVHRLVRLVSDLLDVGRLQSGKFELTLEPVSYDELVRQSVELAQPMTSAHKIKLELPEQAIHGTADSMRIQQVLLNLLSNAINYSPGADQVLVRLREERDEVVLQVTDYGSGIDEHVQELLFTRFYQGQRTENSTRRGLGLGLFISKQIVDAHGGTIKVDSSPGAGSTFTVRLPIQADSVGEQKSIDSLTSSNTDPGDHE